MIRRTLFMGRNGAVKVVMRKVSGGIGSYLYTALVGPRAAIKNDRLVEKLQDSQSAGGQWDHGAEEQTPLQPQGSPRGHVASSSRRGEQTPPAEHGGPPSPGSLGGKREP